MKLIVTLVILLLNYLVFSQIKELKQASDKANQIFEKKRSAIFYPNKYVDPFIGTGAHGHTFPGTCSPFGMIQLSPDTRFDGWDGCSGYHYSDSIIYGFSHTHLSGTGVSDYGDLLILPQLGKPKKLPKYINNKSGFGYKFSHSNENASPGYYTVDFKDVDIKVRLTAGKRSGMHEYTFPIGKQKKSFIIDLEHRDKVLASKIKLIGDSILEGHRTSSAWAKEQHFYFSIRSSSPITKFKKLGKNRYVIFIDKRAIKSYLHVGISSTDIQGARLNRWSEDNKDAFDFASKFTWILSRTMLSWDRHLSKIQIESNDHDVLTNFYTSMYHSMIAPNLISDVDGRYRGMDNKIHKLEKNENQYTVFSLWDTYRATHPLYTIIDTNRSAQFIRTFLRQYNQSGDLPVWELNANETDCMIGYHSTSVITDAFKKGIQGFNKEKALEAMIKTSQIEEFAKEEFHNNGFISSQNEPESVSKNLEYAYDDYCIAEFAKGIGNDSIYNIFNTTSYNFINSFEPTTGFMRARKGAQWFSPFVPEEVNFNYTEANSWQYSLYAPQHLGCLIELLGGKDSLENWLDRLFTCKSKTSGRAQADITGLIGQYAHGNEPSHHMAYLYNFTNKPYKTQIYVDSILQNLYKPLPHGLSGNEDCGQMSSWYVLSSIGIYPITPGLPVYQIGRPLVDKAKIQQENGKTFEINVLNNSKNNKFIQSIRLKDSVINTPFVKHEDILNGSIMTIVMGPKPSKNLSSFITNDTIPNDFISCPYIETEQNIFEDSLLIKINSVGLNSKAKIFFSLDKYPFQEYKNPFYIHNTAEISIKSLISDKIKKIESATLRSKFVKKNQSKLLTLKSKFANQYAASGENSLIDGVFGGLDYRTGDWQGFYGKDVIAEISFQQMKKFSKLGVSCIKDIKSWIFFPKEILIFGSIDGDKYEKISKIVIKKSKEGDENSEVRKFIAKNEKNKAFKHYRFIISNPGKCPDWHLGAGNDTWLFLDEIILE